MDLLVIGLKVKQICFTLSRINVGVVGGWYGWNEDVFKV